MLLSYDQKAQAGTLAQVAAQWSKLLTWTLSELPQLSSQPEYQNYNTQHVSLQIGIYFFFIFFMSHE